MSNKMEQGFLELCEWLQKRTKLNSPIAHDTDLIKNKIVDSLIFVEFLMVIEQSTGLTIEVDENLHDKVKNLASVKKYFFEDESQYV
ncbi:hypothetical protein [Vibrio sp. Isolate30]|jgi:acyl carrier protein|uniref:hypothetical protein n=1 Tax=Vibrio TaxID=662 RepID=UPI001EFE8962|nr:hypothetical protein [Vibrio sp. Isolate30]MCG9629198.1 hypothetical protein [Vibrio sp. Isolate30]